MAPAVFVELILQVGVPAAKHLYSIYKKESLTPEDIAKLDELAVYSDSKALEAIGIKIVDDKVVPI